MATPSLMVAAKSMGYDSCPGIGFDHDAVAKLVNLPAAPSNVPIISNVASVLQYETGKNEIFKGKGHSQ